MKEVQLDSLVENFKRGDEKSLETLFKLFYPIVERHSRKIWYLIEKETEFECRCILKIKTALNNYNPKQGNLKSLILNVVIREARDFLARRRRKIENPISLDEPLETKDGSEIYLEVPDVLADVENDLNKTDLLNEKIALLAKGDPRRKAILKAWMEGENNDSKLAKELAISFPNTAESGHRRFIQRFRTECQKQLAAVFGVQHRYCV